MLSTLTTQLSIYTETDAFKMVVMYNGRSQTVIIQPSALSFYSE